MISGILNIYKEKGYTSHDAVNRLREILRQQKIGHTGTLDPNAEGVLVVCLGKATKACVFLTDKDKTYETVMFLGKTTDTQDSAGKVLAEKDPSHLSKKAIQETIERFVGSYEQLPPMYSALKVKGKRLYELAREGKQIDRKTRTVTISSIKVRKMILPRVFMEVNCSKGTYIRTLCHDIGKSLGCGACMESLIRTRCGRFLLKDSIKISEIEQAKKNGTFRKYILPIDSLFVQFPAVTLSGGWEEAAYNGNPISASWIHASGAAMVRVYDVYSRFIGIYKLDRKANLYRVNTMFFEGQQKG